MTDPKPTKPIRRQYGPICPGCGRVIPIGVEDLDPSLDISVFREILRQRGHTVRWEPCATPNCGHSAETKLHLLQFGKLDATLPAEETF